MLGFPVAAKLASRRVQHKTDVGGVRLNLAADAAVRRAFADIVGAARGSWRRPIEIDGVLIQPMITGGVETMIGVADDPLFGPLVGFGLGGIHVEVLGDVRFRIAPLTDRDADELLHEIRGFPLLQGYRGHPPADIDALRERAAARVAAGRRGAGDRRARSQSGDRAARRPRLPHRRRADQGPRSWHARNAESMADDFNIPPFAATDFDRRTFLDALLAVGFVSTAAAIAYPVARYLVPPASGEPATQTRRRRPGRCARANAAAIFKFGSKPGIVVRTAEGELRAFSAVCTHLDCTVQFKTDTSQLWCACHNGIYDLGGNVVSGPPPRALEQFVVNLRGEGDDAEIVVSRMRERVDRPGWTNGSTSAACAISSPKRACRSTRRRSGTTSAA